jgi:hypothetical protein
LACQENQIDKKIELLQQTIELYEKAKNWFYRTKGGEIYFQDFFEYLHNSQNDCYSYITPIKKYLEECIYHRDYLIPEILNIIASHPNGILQKDIYKYIPSVSKNEIQKINNFLANRGDILKIKSGNSYLLTIRTQ